MKRKISIAISGIGNRALPKDKNKAFWSGWVDQIKKSNKPEKDLTISCAYIGCADMVIVTRPDLYKAATEKFDIPVLNAKKAVKALSKPHKKGKAA